MPDNENTPGTVRGLPVSFEFFPPKTDKGMNNLLKARDGLAEKNPAFFSVTYGAGGSTRDTTFNAVMKVKECGIDTAPHLSCVGQKKSELKEILASYRDNGISRIVTLRGDLPSGMAESTGELKYASDLVTFIREEFGDTFTLEVAAYPEMHPQAASPSADFLHFRHKLDCGADSAITQYFYNPDAYFYFIDQCEAAGITTPVYPGIMPITNVKNLMRFSDNCGAEIPRWIRTKLSELEDDDASVMDFGIDVVSVLCETLLNGGAPGLHFYTMNQSGPTLSIIDNLD